MDYYAASCLWAALRRPHSGGGFTGQGGPLACTYLMPIPERSAVGRMHQTPHVLSRLHAGHMVLAAHTKAPAGHTIHIHCACTTGSDSPLDRNSTARLQRPRRHRALRLFTACRARAGPQNERRHKWRCSRPGGSGCEGGERRCRRRRCRRLDGNAIRGCAGGRGPIQGHLLLGEALGTGLWAGHTLASGSAPLLQLRWRRYIIPHVATSAGHSCSPASLPWRSRRCPS